MSDCDEKQREIDSLESKLSALQALYDDHECVCHECDRREEEDDQSPAEAVDVWLTRAKGLGQLTAAETAVVERLLGDLS